MYQRVLKIIITVIGNEVNYDRGRRVKRTGNVLAEIIRLSGLTATLTT